VNIPWVNVQEQNAALRDEILPLWEEILCTGQFTGGHVEAFETAFAQACGMPYVCAVSSGTDALRMVFLGLDLADGDEVITVPNTFVATAETITQANGRVAFADIDPETYTLDPAALEKAITPKTKGVVPVHLYGQMADMAPILKIARRHGLWVVEDAAQAHLAEYQGHKAGSMGVAAAFSFYPTKNLGACGEAGAVVTADETIANRIRVLRDHGQLIKNEHILEGFNNRCDNVQAAALRVKLKHLPAWNERRRHLAAHYLRRLENVSGVTLPHVPAGRLPSWHLFVIQVDDRDTVQAKLAERGIHTGIHYPTPLHLQPAYQSLGYSEGAFPHAERASRRILSLPMYPELTEEQVDYVCEQLSRIV